MKSPHTTRSNGLPIQSATEQNKIQLIPCNERTNSFIEQILHKIIFILHIVSIILHNSLLKLQQNQDKKREEEEGHICQMNLQLNK